LLLFFEKESGPICGFAHKGGIWVVDVSFFAPGIWSPRSAGQKKSRVAERGLRSVSLLGDGVESLYP